MYVSWVRAASSERVVAVEREHDAVGHLESGILSRALDHADDLARPALDLQLLVDLEL